MRHTHTQTAADIGKLERVQRKIFRFAKYIFNIEKSVIIIFLFLVFGSLYLIVGFKLIYTFYRTWLMLTLILFNDYFL